MAVRGHTYPVAVVRSFRALLMVQPAANEVCRNCRETHYLQLKFQCLHKQQLTAIA